ncbi:MAG: hypothetical protein ACNYPI_08600 [Arenicellales bacterium WSBS_2016_MAG_OTU3]
MAHATPVVRNCAETARDRVAGRAADCVAVRAAVRAAGLTVDGLVEPVASGTLT